MNIGSVVIKTSAMGDYALRVLRQHRDAGYVETVVIGGGHPALLGSIQIEEQRRLGDDTRYSHVTCLECLLDWQRIDWGCALHRCARAA